MIRIRFAILLALLLTVPVVVGCGDRTGSAVPTTNAEPQAMPVYGGGPKGAGAGESIGGK